ncbi:MAG: SDR family oxidoreductase [Bernardetiaceae bacterium]|jgi:UDP-N-acetylglucosamine 4-epimerase|nr:SDR family oxidoreductase [Bernardetiaceae bacterium]
MSNQTRLISGARVLVTGGAGFIGANLCERLLAQDNEVVCLDNFATSRPENLAEMRAHPWFTLVEGDIRHLADCQRAVAGVDYVLHHAALGSVPRSIKDPHTTNEVNVSGFLNMLAAAAAAKVKRFVYASSSSVYGDYPGSPKVEAHTGRLLSPYAVSKWTNELYAGVFARLHGLPCVGLRYFNVFGRRQSPEGEYAAVIPRFVKALLAGQAPIIYGDGTQARDFTYIDNVLLINNLAATATLSAPTDQVYNVACGTSTSLNALFGLLRDLLARYQPAVAQVQPQYGPARPGDILFSLADIGSAQRQLGYVPTHQVAEGLALAMEWYWAAHY